MGQEIVYCVKCQIRLAGSDFERGKAFRVDAQVACLNCVRDLLNHLPDPDAELERLKKQQIPKVPGASSSSTRISAVQPLLPDASTRRIHNVPLPPAEPPNRIGVVLLVIGGVVLLLFLALFLSSDSKRSGSTPRPDPESPSPAAPPLRSVKGPSSSKPPSGPSAELEELDARVLALLREKKFAEAAKALSDARGRRTSVEWAGALEERSRKVEAEFFSLTAPLLERVGPAVRKGDDGTVKNLRRELESTGVPGAVQAFEKAVQDAKADPWVILPLSRISSEGGATFSIRGDGSVLVSGTNPARDTYSAVASLGFRKVRAFRIEALTDASLSAGGPGRGQNGNFVLTEFRVLSAGHPLSFAGSSSDFEQDQFPSSAAVDGNPRTGWAIAPRLGQAATATFQLAAPVDLGEVALVLEFQSAWGLHTLGCFRISATSVELPAPPAARPANDTPLPIPKPPPVEVSPDVLAWSETWGKVAQLASGRDFAGAVKILEEARRTTKVPSLRKEAEEDVANVQSAADLLAEVPRLLGRWTRGTKLKVDYIAPDGMTDLVEGILVESSPRGVVLQTEGGVIEIPAGELGAGTVAALVGLRGEKREGDAKALALLSAAEGRPLVNLPARYASLRGGAGPQEREARSILWKAESDFPAMKTRGAAGAAYATLLEKYGQTSFVLRNRPFLEERVQAARDYLFFADELSGGGTFSPVSLSKVDPSWISIADSPPGKAAGNFVEAEVQIDAGATYRGWVYAGGCCQEVLTFYIQGTGLSGPSAKNPRETVATRPGGEEWIPVRPTASSLKKKHTDHVGPKQPERWMWVDLGILKFAEPGLKKLRILTEEKGFSVAYLAVTALRQGPPRDSEVKELSKGRPPQILESTGSALREVWKGIGGWQLADLQGNPKFVEGVPDESGLLTSIDSSNLGENYGCRIRGYLHPPVTGEYTFWISSDDEGELSLSSDDHPAKKQKICGLSHPVAVQDWNADPSQKSAPVKLAAGQRYYFEVVQKQGTGPEHVAVGWQLPGGGMERPIPGTRLSPPGAFPPRRALRPALRQVPLEGPATRSPYVGGSGGQEFEDLPDPRQLLRGFRYALTGEGGLFTLQPVYSGRQRDTEGRRYGGAEPSGQVTARPGFAVGGMVARGTDRLNAFKLIFMRISGGQVDSADRYESDWIGTRPGGEEVLFGGAGKPAIGIFGRSAWEIDGAGLILSGK